MSDDHEDGDNIFDFKPRQASLAGEPEATERLSLLPSLNSPYKAAGFAITEVTRFVVMMGQAGFKPGGKAYRTFQFMHLGEGDFGFTPEGHTFRFVFEHVQPRLLIVRGRDLVRTYEQISLHRMHWIRLADRDFRPADEADGEPIITGIEIRNWNPGEE